MNGIDLSHNMQSSWTQPPGSQRVIYWRRAGALEVGVPKRSTRRPARPVTTMLLALTTPSGNQSALPSVTRTLPQAELFHRAIVSRVAKGQRVHCPELTGKDEHDRPLREGHRHAHVLPVDLDGDGRLDHIIVYAPMGLGGTAQQAIRSLRRTWTKGGGGALQLAIAAIGSLDSLRKLPEPLVQQLKRLLGKTPGATTWTSITPFVPSRFPKPRGTNTLAGQVTAELQSRGLPRPLTIQVLDFDDATLFMRHFVRTRRGNRPPPVDVGYSIRLSFAEPMSGPICLGYASHFGLGLFGAIEE